MLLGIHLLQPRRLLPLALSLAMLFAGAGCDRQPSAPDAPLRTIEHRWTEGQLQKRLLVYLPGRGDQPEDFQKRGLLEDLRQRGMAFDVIAVDAPLKRYIDRSIVTRLRQDVILPAQAKGYQEIWAVGNSLGSLGALLTEMEHPGSWDTALLIAPFLGRDKSLLGQIKQAGGVAHWTPLAPVEGEGFERELWAWLKDYPLRSSERPKLRLAYGLNDKFADLQEQLAGLLPTENVQTTKGGHNWTVWRELWIQLLNQQQP